jgi:predicted AAA+ superfamily ATPase
MIKRESYLSKIRNFYDDDLIKVITGVRRCGKSMLLIQIIDELKDRKVNDDHIIYINFEDFKYNEFTKDLKLFNDSIVSKIADKKLYYLFFDEIQMVEDFEKVVNSFRATLNVSIFMTGSNGKLLSGELATYLTGRYVSFKIMPFSFSEHLELKEMQNNLKTIEEEFNEYLTFGGMPALYKFKGTEEKNVYLNDLYSTIVLKDITFKNKIKDIDLLNRIMQFIMENVGGTISANSIKNYLKKENIVSSFETIMNYIEYIASSMIINKVNRYDIRGKNVMATLEKYYLVDLGLFKLKKSEIEENISGKLENVIYNELIKRGYTVYIGKTVNGEIDFIVTKDGEKKYLQVCDYLSSNEVKEREFGAFKNIKDNYPKYVLTMGTIDYSNNGIIQINILDFLMGKKDI